MCLLGYNLKQGVSDVTNFVRPHSTSAPVYVSDAQYSFSVGGNAFSTFGDALRTQAGNPPFASNSSQWEIGQHQVEFLFIIHFRTR